MAPILFVRAIRASFSEVISENSMKNKYRLISVIYSFYTKNGVITSGKI